jgi:hypothetical protein
MKKFEDYIEESYLKSNFAPLYHFTSIWVFNSILKEDMLNVGYYENPINGEKDKFVSLTRNKDFDLSFRKTEVRLDLDQNLLRNDFNIIPYDFFIHSNQEQYPKSSIKRIKPFEFEEIILKDIKNLHKYLININFSDIESLFKSQYTLYEYIEKYNTELSIDNKKINLSDVE